MPLAMVVVPTAILLADAEMVHVPPRAQDCPLTVVAEFTRTLFGIVPAPETVPVKTGLGNVFVPDHVFVPFSKGTVPPDVPVFWKAAVPNADPFDFRHVITPVVVTKVQSPDTVKPASTPALLYCTWPFVPADVEIVHVPPKAQFWPLTVVELFTKTEFGTVPAPATVPVNVGEARVRPETVEAVPPNDTAVEPIVTVELASTVFGTVPAPETVPVKTGLGNVLVPDHVFVPFRKGILAPDVPVF
jgi:hypothetical protein